MNEIFTSNIPGFHQNIIIPNDICFVTITAIGAGGGGGFFQNSSNLGGKGAIVIAKVAVTPGEMLDVQVGGIGVTNDPGTGGIGGGAGAFAITAGGGGGASVV